MAHYAKVNQGIVENIIVAEPEFFDDYVDTSPGDWIKTSYNTRGGVHYEVDSDGIQRFSNPSADQSKALRKNYAEIGGTYDSENDAFIPVKRFRTWVLNETTFIWEPPIPAPTITGNEVYDWFDDVYEADTNNPKTQGWVLRE